MLGMSFSFNSIVAAANFLYSVGMLRHPRCRRSKVSMRAAAMGSGRSRNVSEKVETKLDAKDASGSIGVRRCCMRCRVSIAAGAGKRESS